MRRIVPIIVHSEPSTYYAIFLWPTKNSKLPIMAWEWELYDERDAQPALQMQALQSRRTQNQDMEEIEDWE